MEEKTERLDLEPNKHAYRSLNFNRGVALAAGINYLIWWFVVEATLPGSYNPLPSRLAVIFLLVLIFTLSFVSAAVKKNMAKCLTACLWIITLHLFYLFYRNNADINWIVGSYTAVTAVIAVLQDEVSLLAYSSFVLILSLLLTFFNPALLHSIFLIGMFTFVTFGFFGSRNRVKSERNRILYEASRETIRNHDEFFSIVAHELKTPLTSIKLQTQMAKRSLAKGDLSAFNPERMKTLIEQTDRQATRLTKLVNEMLDISNIDSGQLKMHKIEFDLLDLIQKSVANFDSTSIQVISSGPVLICADEYRIEQVIENLLSNALKYGKGLPIQIEIKKTSTEVQIIFTDHGIGISDEDHSRIFQRYERAVDANKISGLGLGLYIAKNIVEAHRGSIQVSSELGHGSQFRVVLPL